MMVTVFFSCAMAGLLGDAGRRALPAGAYYSTRSRQCQASSCGCRWPAPEGSLRHDHRPAERADGHEQDEDVVGGVEGLRQDLARLAVEVLEGELLPGHEALLPAREHRPHWTIGDPEEGGELRLAELLREAGRGDKAAERPDRPECVI